MNVVKEFPISTETAVLRSHRPVLGVILTVLFFIFVDFLINHLFVIYWYWTGLVGMFGKGAVLENENLYFHKIYMLWFWGLRLVIMFIPYLSGGLIIAYFLRRKEVIIAFITALLFKIIWVLPAIINVLGGKSIVFLGGTKWIFTSAFVMDITLLPVLTGLGAYYAGKKGLFAGPKTKKPVRIFAISAIAFLLFLTANWIIQDRRYAWMIEEEINQLKLAGEPTTAEDFIRPPIPKEENAALVYSEAENLFEDGTKEEQDAFIKVGDQEKILTPEDLQLLRSLLKKNGKALELFYKGAEYNKSHFPITIEEWLLFSGGSPYLSGNIDSILESLKPRKTKGTDLTIKMSSSPVRASEISSGGKLITAQILIQLEEDKPNDALKACYVGLKLGNSFSNDPFLITALLRLAINKWMVDSLRNILKYNNFDPTLLKTVLNELDKSKNINMTGEIRPMRVMKIEMYKTFFSSLSYMLFDSYSLQYKYETLLVLKRNKQQVAALEAPYYQAEKNYSQLETELKEISPIYTLLFMERIMSEGIWRIYTHCQEYEAKVDLARIAIASKIYKLQHGRYSDNLNVLSPDSLTAVPIDHFSGRGYIYRKEGNGFIVYSVGRNLIDDGGKEEKEEGKGDIVWRCKK